MAPMNYVKQSRIWLKQSPDFNEQWLQNRIEEDTSLLGLGDVIVRDSQRIQPSGGRLDLLLQAADGDQRYEVEIQLGATDESHIIRTLEYWDIERKMYPQYEHAAVIIAEDITSRFLNVISLFNGSIPVIAIQMQALKVGDATTLVFTTVLDVMTRGLAEEDEVQPPADRQYWEHRATKSTVEMADSVLSFVQEVRPELELNYNRFYIGLVHDGIVDNFVQFRPRKSALNLEFRLPQQEEIDALIDESGADTLDYDRKWKRYRLRFSQSELTHHQDLIKELVRRAAEHG